MTNGIEDMKVFISYSWTTTEHQDWVIELATRLRENGVDVVLDKWDLKEGQSIYHFMESMVKNPDIQKVIVVCDHGYKSKADAYKGGAGVEVQIITPEIYDNVEQEKFIPVIAEIDHDGSLPIPLIFKSRKYIDMSSDETYEGGYEQLLRNIFGRPEYRKPAKGTPPMWLFEDEPNHSKTTNSNKALRDAVNRKPDRVKYYIQEFIESFFIEFDMFTTNDWNSSKQVDDVIIDSIDNMKPLRDEYLNFLETCCTLEKDFDIDIIAEMFEKMYTWTKFREGLQTAVSFQFDIYKFFILEVFIYTIAILLKHERFDDVSNLTSRIYFLQGEMDSRAREANFTHLRFYVKSLDEYRKNRLQLNKLSITAQTIIDRTDYKGVGKAELIDADIILAYLSVLHSNYPNYEWFPITYVYATEDKSIRLLQRLVSTKHCEKTKPLFNAKTIEELIDKITQINSAESSGYRNSSESIPRISNHIQIERISSSI